MKNTKEFPRLDLKGVIFEKTIVGYENIMIYREACIADSKNTSVQEISMTRKRSMVPIWEKSTLTLEECAELSGIGIHKLRELTDARGCKFVLWNGNRRLIKRNKFEEYIDEAYSI